MTDTNKNTNPAEESITDRIASLVDGSSVAAFARKCGVSETVMRKYLNGAMPGSDKLIQIAEANGVSVQWLATGRELPPPQSPLEIMERAHEHELQSIYQNLSSEPISGPQGLEDARHQLIRQRTQWLARATSGENQLFADRILEVYFDDADAKQRNEARSDEELNSNAKHAKAQYDQALEIAEFTPPLHTEAVLLALLFAKAIDLAALTTILQAMKLDAQDEKK